ARSSRMASAAHSASTGPSRPPPSASRGHGREPSMIGTLQSSRPGARQAMPYSSKERQRSGRTAQVPAADRGLMTVLVNLCMGKRLNIRYLSCVCRRGGGSRWMAEAVDALIARVLGIAEARVTRDLEFQSIREWNSLNHVELMLALEEAYGSEIDADLV